MLTHNSETTSHSQPNLDIRNSREKDSSNVLLSDVLLNVLKDVNPAVRSIISDLKIPANIQRMLVIGTINVADVVAHAGATFSSLNSLRKGETPTNVRKEMETGLVTHDAQGIFQELQASDYFRLDEEMKQFLNQKPETEEILDFFADIFLDPWQVARNFGFYDLHPVDLLRELFFKIKDSEINTSLRRYLSDSTALSNLLFIPLSEHFPDLPIHRQFALRYAEQFRQLLIAVKRHQTLISLINSRGYWRQYATLNLNGLEDSSQAITYDETQIVQIYPERTHTEKSGIELPDDMILGDFNFRVAEAILMAMNFGKIEWKIDDQERKQQGQDSHPLQRALRVAIESKLDTTIPDDFRPFTAPIREELTDANQRLDSLASSHPSRRIALILGKGGVKIVSPFDLDTNGKLGELDIIRYTDEELVLSYLIQYRGDIGAAFYHYSQYKERIRHHFQLRGDENKLYDTQVKSYADSWQEFLFHVNKVSTLPRLVFARKFETENIANITANCAKEAIDHRTAYATSGVIYTIHIQRKESGQTNLVIASSNNHKQVDGEQSKNITQQILQYIEHAPPDLDDIDTDAILPLDTSEAEGQHNKEKPYNTYQAFFQAENILSFCDWFRGYVSQYYQTADKSLLSRLTGLRSKEKTTALSNKYLRNPSFLLQLIVLNYYAPLYREAIKQTYGPEKKVREKVFKHVGLLWGSDQLMVDLDLFGEVPHFDVTAFLQMNEAQRLAYLTDLEKKLNDAFKNSNMELIKKAAFAIKSLDWRNVLNQVSLLFEGGLRDISGAMMLSGFTYPRLEEIIQQGIKYGRTAGPALAPFQLMASTIVGILLKRTPDKKEIDTLFLSFRSKGRVNKATKLLLQLLKSEIEALNAQLAQEECNFENAKKKYAVN